MRDLSICRIMGKEYQTMTNREKFAEKILDIACGGSKIAVSKATLEPTACRKLACGECLFNTHGYGHCRGEAGKWANSEYVEPPVDWSKVAVDTPILVRNSEEEVWEKRHFAKYENGIVYAWSAGSTSWSARMSNDITDWKFAKLAESEEKND